MHKAVLAFPFVTIGANAEQFFGDKLDTVANKLDTIAGKVGILPKLSFRRGRVQKKLSPQDIIDSLPAELSGNGYGGSSNDIVDEFAADEFPSEVHGADPVFGQILSLSSDNNEDETDPSSDDEGMGIKEGAASDSTAALNLAEDMWKRALSAASGTIFYVVHC